MGAVTDLLTLLHGNTEGNVAIFSGVRPNDGGVLTDTTTEYVAYPRDLDTVPSVIANQVDKGRDVYWCAHLLTEKRRIKANASPIKALYADVDDGTIPDHLTPSALVESSPGRRQGYWFLEESTPAEDAEQLNHRIALATGADASGWDLTQLLRPPGTPNRKYADEPIVRVVACDPTRRYTPAQLDAILPPIPVKPKPTPPAFQHETVPLSVDDETVRRRARLSQKFRDTESGDNRHYDGDASDADQGYADSLAGAGADSPEQVIRIWQAGRRWRPKCDEVHYADGKTYAEGTAAKAFDGYVQNRYARNEAILVAHQPSPEPVASESDDVTYWRTRAETAEALVAGLQKMVETLELENAEIRQENSTIINVTTNPSLKAEAPTVIRTVIDVQEAKRRGDVDEDGYVRISTSKIGDDYGDDRFDGLDSAIRSRSTVNRHLKKMADLGMIEREVRTVMAPRILRDKDKKPVIDPETNRPKTYEASTDQTWVKLTGESITDALRPFALFRAPETMPGEPPKVKRHGGDRRSADFKANRTPCPDCGSTDRVSWCAGCGSDITAVAEADEMAAHLAEPPAFQDAPYIKRGYVPTFQDETGGSLTSTSHLTLIAHGRSSPQPLASPPVDWGVTL